MVSNSSWSPSGYGVQIRNLVPRIKDAGHEIAVSAFFGLQGGEIVYDGVKHYPAGFRPYGNDSIPVNAEDFGADLVITLIDVWVLETKLFESLRIVPWSPIDHTPVPGPVLDRLRRAWQVMVYSKFAEEELLKVGFSNFDYIPHAVDTKIFHPMPERKQELRRKFSIPEDAFVVGMVAANQSHFPTRKGFERIFPAIANLAEKYDDLYLYVHSYVGTEMGGIPLVQLAQAFDITDRVYFSRPTLWISGGLSRPELAELYNCFDILAMPSMSEGFGIPAIEAQSCGIPIIATNFSALRELCFSEWYIEPITMYMTPMFAFQAVPSVKSIEERIEYAYNHREEIVEKGQEARERALAYDWDTVFENYWVPTLEKYEKRLKLERKKFREPKMTAPITIEPKSGRLIRRGDVE